MDQSEIEAMRASKSRLVLVQLLIGKESCANFFNQSESEIKQNQSKHNISFDTHLKLLYTVPNYVIQWWDCTWQEKKSSVKDWCVSMKI